MPLYCFQGVDGNLHERFFSMDDAPAFGETIVSDGIEMTRVTSFIVGTKWVPFGGRIGGKYPYVSRSLPKTMGDCEKDKKGRPIIKSKRHEDQLRKKYNLVEVDRPE